MKNYIYTAASVVVLSLVSCSSQPNRSYNDVAAPVSVTEIKPAPISRFINTSGNALASKEAVLKSQMSGRYKLQINPATGRPFKLGDKVKEGQIIVRFEDEEYENSLSVESKKLSCNIAEQDQNKQQALYEKGGVTFSDLRKSEVTVMNSRSDYESALLKQEYMYVKAPFDGVIVDLPHFTPNIKVESGATIVSVMDYSKLYMDINLPENAIPYVKAEQSVIITHYTIPNDTVNGVISELSPAINQETRTFKGKLIIDNNKLLIRPGMFVKADIRVEHNTEVIVIPKKLIMSRGRNNKYVYVLDKNAARQCEITTGIEDKFEVEVVKGLNVGDQLITTGYETLRDESKVKVER